MSRFHDDRAVRRWLVAAAIAIIAAVVLGGITRLTESGLSITVWQPVRGVLPPRSAAEWQHAYQQFLLIPQAQGVHSGISLAEFRTIFWWEWTHRLLARLVGLVLVVPYLVLLLRDRIQPRLRLRLAWLPILTLAQGALGWYMVASGLQDRSSVSPYRLAAHLALALVIWAICVWTIAELTPAAERRQRRWLQRLIAGITALVAITLVSGALVAGLDAGLVYNTFPLMGDGVVPPGYGSVAGDWRLAFENPVIAQFHHRVLATLAGVSLLLLPFIVKRAGASRALLSATSLAAAVAVLQVVLGITTLLLRVPLPVAVLHQLTGVLLLGVVIWALERSRGGTLDTPAAGT